MTIGKGGRSARLCPSMAAMERRKREKIEGNLRKQEKITCRFCKTGVFFEKPGAEVVEVRVNL